MYIGVCDVLNLDQLFHRLQCIQVSQSIIFMVYFVYIGSHGPHKFASCHLSLLFVIVAKIGLIYPIK